MLPFMAVELLNEKALRVKFRDGTAMNSNPLLGSLFGFPDVYSMARSANHHQV
jgi:hypothetical protein